MAPSPPAAVPPGLHLHLVPWGQSLRFALWFERYADPRAYRAKARLRDGDPHPGCLDSPPSWLAGAPALRIYVRLPRLGNGFPVALPGVLPAWDLDGFSARGRTLATGCYAVFAWLTPPPLSLAPLRAFLLEWRARLGAGCLAPQTERVVDFLDELHARLAEGPLLPALAPPAGDAADGGPSPTQALCWVPPVSLAEVQRLLAPLEADPFLAAVEPWRLDRSCLSERYPSRFVRFLVEILGAAAAAQCSPFRPDQGPGWTPARLRAALAAGDESLLELHRAHGSCLHPHHPVFRPPALPPGHLHARVHSAGPGAPPERPLLVELGLATGESWLPLRALAEWGGPRDRAVDHEGATFFRPWQVLFRDWSLMVDHEPLLRRPELLGDGRGPLSEPDAERLLAHEPFTASGYELQRFREREGLERGPYRKQGFAIFSAAPGQAAELRLRVRWDLLADDAARGPDLSLVRFVPHLALALGDGELPLDEAERLLRDSTSPILHLGDQVLERASLLGALELARARATVLTRLAASGGLSFGQVGALEDEWVDDLDAARQESVFAARWEQFLAALAGAAGVPRLTTPPHFGGQLRPYQERGLSWLAFLAGHGLGGCLADDMGLGKTVQVLALLLGRRGDEARSLVVCPTSVVTNWAREAGRFTPDLQVHVHQGPQRARDEAAFRERVRTSDVVVTSWALARRDCALLASVGWDLVIADEAQNLKNPAARQTRAVKELTARARLALTGTPVENHLRDLWSIFDFVSPGLLGGPTRFARAFLTPLRAGSAPALTRLRRRVGPFLLRRTKSEVAPDLPPKQEQEVYCDLTREQVALYRAMSEAAVAGLVDKAGMKRKAHILQALLHLKQICNHPENFAAESARRLRHRSGKLERVLELLEELLDEEQPTLVYTQFTRMGALLADAIEERFGLSAPFFHGGLRPAERDALVAAFQADGGPPILLLSLRAGGTGLNLTRARAVIHYDRWWNPAVEDQATDRAHRIGQTGMVNVYKLVTRGTVEERIQQLLGQKRELARRVLGSSDESWLTELSDAGLRELFTLGALEPEPEDEDENEEDDRGDD